jgi:hypothetical protein
VIQGSFPTSAAIAASSAISPPRACAASGEVDPAFVETVDHAHPRLRIVHALCAE